MRKSLLALSTVLALSLVACAEQDSSGTIPETTATQNVAGDCDTDDQHEHDEDCGYYNEGGVFVFYPWVVKGNNSKPPKGWDRTKYHQDHKVTDNRDKYHTATPNAPKTANTQKTAGNPAKTGGAGTNTNRGGNRPGGVTRR